MHQRHKARAMVAKHMGSSAPLPPMPTTPDMGAMNGAPPMPGGMSDPGAVQGPGADAPQAPAFCAGGMVGRK